MLSCVCVFFFTHSAPLDATMVLWTDGGQRTTQSGNEQHRLVVWFLQFFEYFIGLDNFDRLNESVSCAHQIIHQPILISVPLQKEIKKKTLPFSEKSFAFHQYTHA